MGDTLRFSVPEILSLLGAAQCIYILVYMLLRSGRLSRGTLPAIYFMVLALAFLSDAAQRFWSPVLPLYSHLQWLFWFSGPPVSMLLVIQIARITSLPALKNYAILLAIPLAYAAALAMTHLDMECSRLFSCPEMQEWLTLTGLIMGGLSILALWLRRELLDGLHLQKGGRNRFWLIIALIVLNVAFLGAMLGVSWGILTPVEGVLIRTVIGLAFVYVASTSLLRLYPQAMRISGEQQGGALTDEEIATALKIERLIHMEKVYQEPAYGRRDLAREVNLSEAALSRIVNKYFDKSVPQLLNEARIRESKILLEQTDAAVRVIAQESGFNSLASFNRVFKDTTGQSPSEYRQVKKA